MPYIVHPSVRYAFGAGRFFIEPPVPHSATLFPPPLDTIFKDCEAWSWKVKYYDSNDDRFYSKMLAHDMYTKGSPLYDISRWRGKATLWGAWKAERARLIRRKERKEKKEKEKKERKEMKMGMKGERNGLADLAVVEATKEVEVVSDDDDKDDDDYDDYDYEKEVDYSQNPMKSWETTKEAWRVGRGSPGGRITRKK